MGSNSGYIVEFPAKDGIGIMQRGIVLYKEQEPQFREKRKFLVSLVNDDGSFIRDEAGKVRRVLKFIELCKIIGFVD